MQREGIKYIGMRHEQSASYAAGAVGYLTGRPGACLVVSGPGMTNAISGLGNAQTNCWPMILLGGANGSDQMGMGAFQEAPQMMAAAPFTKYAMPARIAGAPAVLRRAGGAALHLRPPRRRLPRPARRRHLRQGRRGRPEAVTRPPVPEPPRTMADPSAVAAAIDALKSAPATRS